MGFEIYYMNTEERKEFLKKEYGLENVIYMGDSFVDTPVFESVAYGIATETSDFFAKYFANYVTTTGGGERAVAEAVFWIMKNILKLDKVEIAEGYFLPINLLEF